MMSNKLQPKKLALALATALGGAVLASPVHAVNLADDGIGEVLVYQYYTNQTAATGAWQTFFHVVNTSADVVAVKVNFREAQNSRDVLDFVLVLSAYDVWTGFTTNDQAGNPVLRTTDRSCTSPPFVPAAGAANPDARQLSFRNTGYTGPRADGGPAGLDRTREGYVEMINIGHAFPGSNIADAATHDPLTGIPANCAVVASAFNAFPIPPATIFQFTEPRNVLKGNGYMFNSAIGQAGGFDPVVLANFFNPGAEVVADPFLPPPTTVFGRDGAAFGLSLVGQVDSFRGLPDLNAARPAISVVRDDTPGIGPRIIVDQWTRGADAVSAVLMRNEVHNEWASRINAAVGLNNSTEWVVTFPTKRFYADQATATVPPAIAPFTNHYTGLNTACHNADAWIFDREERTSDNQSPPLFPVELQLCNEVNVLTFRADEFGSQLNSQVPVRTLISGIDTGANTIRREDLPLPILLAGDELFFGYLKMMFDNTTVRNGDTTQPNAHVGRAGGLIGTHQGLGSDPRADQIYNDAPAPAVVPLGVSPPFVVPGPPSDGTWLGWCATFWGVDGAGNRFYTFSGTADGNSPPLPADPTALPPAGFGALAAPVPGGILPSTLVQAGLTHVPFLATLNTNLIGLDPDAQPPRCPNLINPSVVGGTEIVPTYLFNNTDGWAHYAGYPTVGFTMSFRSIGGDAVRNYSSIVEHGYSRQIQILRERFVGPVPQGDLVPSLRPASYFHAVPGFWF